MKKTLALLVITLLSILGPTSVFAPASDPPGSDGWTSIGPPGGIVRGMDANPKNPKELYAVLGSSPSSVYKSKNGGSKWKKIFESSNPILWDVTVNPRSPRTVYVLASNSLFRSKHRGANFSSIPFDSNCYMTCLAVDSKDSGLIWAGGSYYLDMSANHSCMAVMRSEDGGQTWKIAKFEISVEQAQIVALSQSPVNSKLLYAAGWKSVGGNWVQNGYRSTDGGKHWTELSSLQTQHCYLIVAHPTNSRKAYAGCFEGVFRTANRGRTWKKQKGSLEFAASGLAIDPARPDTMYAGCMWLDDQASRGCYRSDDGGKRWTQSLKGLYGQCNQIILAGTSVFFATQGAGIYKSLDGGESWKQSHSGINAARVTAFALAPSSPSTIIAALYKYTCFITQNGGRSWQNLPRQEFSDYIEKIIVQPLDSDTVYFMTGGCPSYLDGVYRSVDGGKKFDRVLKSKSWNLTTHPEMPEHMIVSGRVARGGSSYLGIHLSSDGGSSWKSIKVGRRNGTALVAAFHPHNANTIYVGGAGESLNDGWLYKSTNGGQIWTNITGPLQFAVSDIAIDPDSPSFVHVGTDSGFWKSKNGGTSWTKTFAFGGVSRILVNPTDPNELFICGVNKIFTSTDKGENWSEISLGVAEPTVELIDWDPEERILYAESLQGGIRKIRL